MLKTEPVNDDDDDELRFADTLSGALRRGKKRLKGPSRPTPTRRVPPPELPRRPAKPGTQGGVRRPPSRDAAMRPHVLISPLLPEPLLLSHDAKCGIGRDETSAVQIKTDEVSRRHAEIVWNGRCFLIQDLGSTNGTSLNGRPVLPAQPVPLFDKDRLVIGGFEVNVKVLNPGEIPEENLEGKTRRVRVPKKGTPRR